MLGEVIFGDAVGGDPSGEGVSVFDGEESLDAQRSVGLHDDVFAVQMTDDVRQQRQQERGLEVGAKHADHLDCVGLRDEGEIFESGQVGEKEGEIGGE